MGLARDFLPSEYLQKAGSIEAGRLALDTIRALPLRFREPVKSRFSRAAGESVGAANSYIERVGREMCGGALSLAASDGEICNFAKARADDVRSLLMAAPLTSSDDMRAMLVGFCVEFGAVAPPGVLLAGLIGRMTDAGWWRRQARRGAARRFEANAIGLGFVHRRAGLYASDDAVKRHAEQQARNAAALKATEATNEDGLTMTLAQLAAVSVSNPRLRRGELMTRISGFEACAKADGHVGMFYTCTAPSRWHARLAKTGQSNPHYDEDTTPKECAGYLSKTWAKARAWLHRRGINIYGFRVAEPHHDGTPHWHMLFFMLPEVVESVTACIKRYFSEADAHELSTPEAEEARFTAVVIDWARGSAAGYISKYIAKNIDGQRNDLSAVGDDFEAAEQTAADKTAPRVLAWASTWGIRQFQQIGGPGVTIWRELRRIREAVQGDLFDTWSAADTGNWQLYTERQGGTECRRNDRPVQLWKETEEGKTNRYGEAAGAEIKGVVMAGEITVTRLHTWEIRRGGNGSTAQVLEQRGAAKGVPGEEKNGSWLVYHESCNGKESDRGTREGVTPLTLGACAPWSPVNNCTPSKDADGFAVGNFAEQPAPPALPPAEVAKIKAAEVAAILAGIASKRKRGGFGQFPSLNFSNGPGGQHD